MSKVNWQVISRTDVKEIEAYAKALGRIFRAPNLVDDVVQEVLLLRAQGNIRNVRTVFIDELRKEYGRTSLEGKPYTDAKRGERRKYLHVGVSDFVKDGATGKKVALPSVPASQETVDAKASFEERIDNAIKFLKRKFKSKRTGQPVDTRPVVFALSLKHGINLKEIGEILGLTKSRVSQIRTQAVEALTKHLQEHAYA